MRYLLLLLLSTSLSLATAQKMPLNYYLPDIFYNPDIPTPEALLGFQIGEWHISHDQQLIYMRKLAEVSPRITLTEYARTYENRPLVYLTITTETNHANLDQLKAAHIAISDPEKSGKANISNTPTVLYQGFSIHGNEPSGGNAALLVAYYLAAAQTKEVDDLLANTIILLDPCYNPDGFHRFSTWANMHKNKNLTDDSQDREYHEVWPGGRTNHYWFDLNRDWLPVQHPESQGRIAVFHEWKPNVLTDHHEMGSNSTFFYMPGEATRTHPITPKKNQELTAKIGTFHAKALDKIGSLYYSGEGYDDYYYGKGSTYPDGNGCVGILFEQASSRGHLQATENGPLSFPFTIRNQVTTALSTQEATLSMHDELLHYQKDFYQMAMKEARADGRKAYVFGVDNDPGRVDHLVEILRRHQIKVYELAQKTEVKGQTFLPGSAYVVPTEQSQYRLIRAMFETITTFEDTLFYDVSTWTLPLAFNLPYASLDPAMLKGNILGKEIEKLRPEPVATPSVARSPYAYLLDWDHYYAPQALYFLQKEGLRTKVSNLPFRTQGRDFSAGTILIPVQNQEKTEAEIYQLVSQAATRSGAPIIGVNSGDVPAGSDLGSNNWDVLRLPKVLVMVGEGTSSYSAGEIWHVLDQRVDLVVTMAETNDLYRLNLDRYNAIIMPDGRYNQMDNRGAEKLREWVKEGGTLIPIARAVEWAINNGLVYAKKKKAPEPMQQPRRPYQMLSRDAGGSVIGGAIFAAKADLTHPLLFGIHQAELPIFRRGTLFVEPSENAYATPLIYTNNPLLSGYISQENENTIRNTASILVSSQGEGKVIAMVDNPNFRAFWFGTNRLFFNAVFFGNIISNQSTVRSSVRE
ncbi:MAG: peptidase M14 [Saprospiraceae bacterium]|nr:MAG: peptidase M14 [Saprospiraceae bacterium]